MKNIVCPLCQTSNFENLNVELYKCNTCHVQFIHFQEEDNISFYEDYFKKFRTDYTNSQQVKRQLQYKIDSIFFHNNFNGKYILDVGCSSGDFIFHLNDIEKLNYTGIDIDKSGIEIANNYNSSPNINFINVDLLNFKSNTKFDAIVFRGTFQYLSNSFDKYILKTKKLLKPKGLIYIYSLPNSDSFVYNLIGSKWHLYNSREHKLIFNYKSLLFLSNKYQLKIKNIDFPYVNSAYSDLEHDYKTVINIIKNGSKESVPFWGSLIQCILINE